ncbi:MAG: hypothetical protein ACJ0IZ_03270 [Verrucomicrobiales bacterium]|jgi:hypothetical protein|nr:hypothetical protein [Verrucomicrobiales bacterium]
MNRLNRIGITFLIIINLISCKNNTKENKILELEKRIVALEELNSSISKIETIQQTIPLLEALPITMDRIKNIEDKLSDIKNQN